MSLRLSLCLAALLAPLAGFAADAPPDKTLQLRLDSVKADPTEPRNYFNLGLEYYNRGDLAKAASAFQQAIKVNKADKEAHAAVDMDSCQILGNIMLTLKRNSDAVKWFDQGLKITPADPTCLFGRAQAYYADEKKKPAIEAFKRFLTETAGNPKAAEQAPTALNFLGAMALEQKKHDEAVMYFREVVQKYPKQSKEAAYNLSLVLLSKGDALNKKKQFAAAAPLYDEAVAADPTNASALKSSAMAHYQLGAPLIAAKEAEKKQAAAEHFKVAQRNFAAAIKIEPTDFQSTFFLGLSQYQLEMFDQMIASYQKSVELDPSHVGARFNLALALKRKGLFQDAAAQAEEAKKLDAKDPGTNNMLAGIYDEWKADLIKRGGEALSADRLREAVDTWKQVLVIDPHNAEAQENIAKVEPRIAELVQEHLTRGDKAFQEGSIATAVDEWQQAAALDPQNEAVAAKLKNVSAAKVAAALRKKANDAYVDGDYATALTRVDEALKLNAADQASKSLRSKIVKAQTSGFKTIFDKAVKEFSGGKLLAAKRSFESARNLEPSNKKVGDYLQRVAKRIDDTIARGLQEGSDAMRSGNKDAAKKAYAMVLDYDPGNKDAADVIKQLTGKESTAKVSAEKLVEYRKKIITAYTAADMRSVEKLAQEALKLDPGNAEMTTYLKRAQAKLKRSGGAAA